jgi:tetratricopeptide (TPR) repeat protein
MITRKNSKGRSVRFWIVLSGLCVCVLAASCANPLKGKPPYWYNGYVYGTRAHELFSEGRITTALSFYKKGLVQAQTHDIPQQAALYQFNIGRCFLELDKNDSAVHYFTDAYAQFSLCGSENEARQSAGFAAIAWCSTGNNDSAFSWYTKGAIMPSKTDEKNFWLMVHGRLAWGRDHTKEALAYLDAAYDLYKKNKEWYGAMQMCYLRGRVYAYFGDYAEAVRMITEALSLGDKTPLRFDRWRILIATASLYSCTNDPIKAQWFFGRAMLCLPDGIAPLSKEQVMSCQKELFR